MHRAIFRATGLQVWQFGLLLVVVERDATALPGGLACFQGHIVERAAAPQDSLQRPLLIRRWGQLVLVGFAPALLFHVSLFRLTGRRAAIFGTFVAGGRPAFHPQP